MALIIVYLTVALGVEVWAFHSALHADGRDELLNAWVLGVLAFVWPCLVLYCGYRAALDSFTREID